MFGFFRKKKKTEEDVGVEYTEQAKDAVKEDDSDVEEIVEKPIDVKKDKVNLNDTKERLDYLGRLYDAIKESKLACRDVKFEYGQVTSYLKDVQLIDQAPLEEKQRLYTAANNIVELTNERKLLQKKKYKITDAQKRAIEKDEFAVSKDIEKLIGYEDYQRKIKNDLRQLKTEKHLLAADKKAIIRRQRTLKTIGKCTAVICIATAGMIAALKLCFKMDISMPFIGAASFVFVVAMLILNESRKNRIDMIITEKKENKAILLTNRVKIKYINNVKTLDYMYHKYQVKNVTELDFVYSQYRKAKREWAKQRENTLLINENNQVVIEELERLGVKDCDIWLSQTVALVDPKEMVEVRHDLNVRRQKLRDQMDYNTGIMEECIEEMERVKEENPQYAEDVEKILSEG